MKKVLAFTCTHGKRDFLERLVVNMRSTAGMWFDWVVVLSGEGQEEIAEKLLFKEGGTGIQHLVKWKQNKGQHYATKLAIEMSGGYDYLLRLDDDVSTRAIRWLKKMVERVGELDERVGMKDKLVVCPRMVGLKFPIQPFAKMEKGQDFLVEAVPIAGGACRLHPVPLIKHYKPPLHEPVGRMDPQNLALFVESSGGIIVRFPDIKFIHNTQDLEAQDTTMGRIQRRMARYWPYFEVEG